METIKNRLIVYRTYNNFRRDLNRNIIAEDSIVFIEDSNIIWIANHEYVCGGTAIEDSSALNEIRDVIAKLMPIAFTADYKDLKNTPSIPVVDTVLNPASNNALSNSAIYNALLQKANKSDLDNLLDSTKFAQYLEQKQDKLTAGYGIEINDNTISTTLDLTVFEVVDDIHSVTNPNPNKIYIQIDGDTLHQYIYSNGSWNYIGVASTEIDFSIFYTQKEINDLFYNKKYIQNTYKTIEDSNREHKEIWNYINSMDFSPYITEQRIREILNNANYVDLDYVNDNFATLNYLNWNFANHEYLNKNFANIDYVNKTFVKWSDVYEDGKGGSTGGNNNDFDQTITSEVLNTINSLKSALESLQNTLKPVAFSGKYSDLSGIPVVDLELNATSDNAISNKAVYKALLNKADKFDIDDIFLSSVFVSLMRQKQDLLTAGYGIKIEDNVISTTLDTTVFELVFSLENVANPDPSKIYIEATKEGNDYRFKQYIYKDKAWVYLGEANPSINLDDYYTKAEANDKFSTKHDVEDQIISIRNSYYTKAEIDSKDFVQEYELQGYYTKQEIDNKNYVSHDELGDIEYVDLTNYYTKDEVNDLLKNVPSGGGSTSNPNVDLSNYYTREEIDQNFVNWNDVYEDGTGTPSGPSQVGPGNNSGGGKATNLITLTVQEYQDLVDSGSVQEDVYYFTYIDETSQPTKWVFGGTFPITLTEESSAGIGGTFPITLA